MRDDDPRTGDDVLEGDLEDLADADRETRDDELRQGVDDMLDAAQGEASGAAVCRNVRYRHLPKRWESRRSSELPGVPIVSLDAFDPADVLDDDLEDPAGDDVPSSPFDGDAHLLEPGRRAWTPPVPAAGWPRTEAPW